MAHRWTTVICVALALQFASESVHGQDEEVPKEILDPSQNDQLWPIFEKSFDKPANTLGCDDPILTQSDDTTVSADGASYECDARNVRKAVAVPSRDISCSYSPLYFSSNGDNRHWVYADGALLGSSTVWSTTLTVIVPSPTQVIAVKIEDDALVGGFIGSFSDGVTVTDSSWRCTRKLYEGWTGPAYDDSFWPAIPQPRPNGDLQWGLIPGVSSNAQWIWSDSYTTINPPVTVYCRKRINYCIAKPVDICTSYGYSYLPSTVVCDGRKVKVVQLPQLHLFQSCDLVKCVKSDCKCNTCVTRRVNCNLLVYWNFGHVWSYRFCRVPVPGCCSAQCLTYS